MINVLDLTIIINYCALLHVIRTTSFTKDPYPVILNMTDNKSALLQTIEDWTTFSSFLLHITNQFTIGVSTPNTLTPRIMILPM